ncbi:FtsQ Cell division septal protein [Candidatus Nanopelagicaceae bacterium]
MRNRNRAVALSVLIFAALVYLFAWSPVFTVRSIETSGLPSEVSGQSIIARSHIVIGAKLSRIEPRAAEKSLSELSWVQEVSVSRNWINGKVVVAISPRVAVGLYKGKAIDRQGAIFELPGATPRGLPVVSASSPELGLSAISLFTNLPADIREKLISLSAANESSISSWQEWGGRTIKVMWGSAHQVDLKVSVLKALLAQPENKRISRVDLSAPHAPIVK